LQTALAKIDLLARSTFLIGICCVGIINRSWRAVAYLAWRKEATMHELSAVAARRWPRQASDAAAARLFANQSFDGPL